MPIRHEQRQYEIFRTLLNRSNYFKPILIAYGFLSRAFQIGNEWVLSVFSKMNDKFYQKFFLINGSIRLILFVCKFDHRFLLSDIFFGVVLLLCDSNLYNANEYSRVKVYCARWDYIFDTNKICSYGLPTRNRDAKRKFFWWSLLKLKLKLWLNVLYYCPLRSERKTLKCVLHHICDAVLKFWY